ncbi:MAG: acetyltransferase [Chromatiales bacterium]|nr:acetyltransferase [Gammaproteobacteria bacterium]MBW6477334.1 acetyltransferase [Chromatiales bacterium]
MYLQDTRNNDMVEILDTAQLFDPNQSLVRGRHHAGEEMPDPQDFAKATLRFPSGEALPRCWMDAAWRG